MIQALPSGVRQFLAVALFLGLLACSWMLLARPLADMLTARWETLATLHVRVTDLERRSKRYRVLAAAIDDAPAAKSLTSKLVWVGDQTVTGTSLQDLLRVWAAETVGRVVSSAVTAGTKDGLDTLSVEARVEGTNETLAQLLLHLQTQRPPLFIDHLHVASLQAATAQQAGQLAIELRITALIRIRTDGSSP